METKSSVSQKFPNDELQMSVHSSYKPLTVNTKKVQKNKSFELIFLMHLYTKTAMFQ